MVSARSVFLKPSKDGRLVEPATPRSWLLAMKPDPKSTERHRNSVPRLASQETRGARLASSGEPQRWVVAIP
jgi:hypothetical protein